MSKIEGNVIGRKENKNNYHNQDIREYRPNNFDDLYGKKGLIVVEFIKKFYKNKYKNEFTISEFRKIIEKKMNCNFGKSDCIGINFYLLQSIGILLVNEFNYPRTFKIDFKSRNLQLLEAKEIKEKIKDLYSNSDEELIRGYSGYQKGYGINKKNIHKKYSDYFEDIISIKLKKNNKIKKISIKNG